MTLKKYVFALLILLGLASISCAKCSAQSYLFSKDYLPHFVAVSSASQLQQSQSLLRQSLEQLQKDEAVMSEQAQQIQKLSKQLSQTKNCNQKLLIGLVTSISLNLICGSVLYLTLK